MIHAQRSNYEYVVVKHLKYFETSRYYGMCMIFCQRNIIQVQRKTYGCGKNVNMGQNSDTIYQICHTYVYT